MGFTIDMADFEAGLKRLVEQAAPADIREGLFAAGNALLRDAIYEKPYAPFKEGHLRGSAQISEVITQPAEAFVVAGFNICYAARLHELFYGIGFGAEMYPPGWSLPGSGPKYLESKMARNGPRYLAIMGEYLRLRFGG
jgi:hypothetical protein